MITVEQLRATGQFEPFSDAELEAFLGATVTRTFAPREVLCQQSRPATSCFIIVSGEVDVVKESAGRERLLTRLSAGAIAGQLALIDRAPRTASLRASSTVVALELTRDVFERLVSASSPLAFRFRVQIAIATGRQLREANRRLLALLGTPNQSSLTAPGTPDAAARAALEQIQDAVADLDVPFEPFDLLEITPPERIVRRSEPPPDFPRPREPSQE